MNKDIKLIIPVILLLIVGLLFVMAFNTPEKRYQNAKNVITTPVTKAGKEACQNVNSALLEALKAEFPEAAAIEVCHGKNYNGINVYALVTDIDGEQSYQVYWYETALFHRAKEKNLASMELAFSIDGEELYLIDADAHWEYLNQIGA